MADDSNKDVQPALAPAEGNGECAGDASVPNTGEQASDDGAAASEPALMGLPEVIAPATGAAVARSPSAKKARAKTVNQKLGANDAEPPLMDLPEQREPERKPVATSQRTSESETRDDAKDVGSSHDAVDATTFGDRIIEYTIIQSELHGIVLLDPFAVEPEPFNGRGQAIFVPDDNRDLIDDMRIRGNTVPIAVRPRPAGPGWTCPSGSRRLRSAREIRSQLPDFRVRAIIHPNMSDEEAYALCLADNRGRNGVTEFQRAREIAWEFAHLFASDRKKYLAEHAIDPSVLTRALDLAAMPEAILCCADDREQLRFNFAEKVSPRLKEKGDGKKILARATALDGTLPPAKLQRYLLTGEAELAPADRQVRQFGKGRNKVRASCARAADGSATIKVPAVSRLTIDEQAALAEFLREVLADLTGGAPGRSGDTLSAGDML